MSAMDEQTRTLCAHMSRGNRKLPKSNLIFNLCAAADCPSRALGMCQLGADGCGCYADTSERVYPDVLPYRRRQEKVFGEASAEAKLTVSHRGQAMRKLLADLRTR